MLAYHSSARASKRFSGCTLEGGGEASCAAATLTVSIAATNVIPPASLIRIVAFRRSSRLPSWRSLILVRLRSVIIFFCYSLVFDSAEEPRRLSRSGSTSARPSLAQFFAPSVSLPRSAIGRESLPASRGGPNMRFFPAKSVFVLTPSKNQTGAHGCVRPFVLRLETAD